MRRPPISRIASSGGSSPSTPIGRPPNATRTAYATEMGRLSHLLGLGPTDEPRRVAVGARRAVTERPVVSTPGARVRVARDGRDGEIGRLLVWLHRRGEPVELLAGEN